MADFNFAFLILFVLILGGLAVSNFVESQSKGQKQLFQPMFGLMYLIFAIGLILYKIQNP